MRHGLTLNPGDQILKNQTHKTGLDLTLIRGCEICDDCNGELEDGNNICSTTYVTRYLLHCYAEKTLPKLLDL